MKKIFRVFKGDLNRIKGNTFAIILMIGVTIIPALYAWFNIYSNWDPYANTNGLKVAVSNTDKGASIEGLSLNVGAMVIDQLAKNDSIGWEFVSEEEAIEGTESGEYYAAVIIPENFSEDILSFTSLTVEQPTVKYYVNEKKNAIATKITDAGITTIQTSINETFISTVTQVISNLALTADSQVSSTETSVTSQIVSDLKSVRENLEQYKLMLTTLQSTSESLSYALDASRSLIPATNNVLSNASSLATNTQSVLAASQTSTDQLLSAISTMNQEILSSIEDEDQLLSDVISGIETDSANAASGLRTISSKVDDNVTSLTTLKQALERIQSALPSESALLAEQIANLQSEIDSLTALSSSLQSAADTIEKTGKLPDSIQQDLKKQMASVKKLMQTMKSTYDSSLKTELSTLFSGMYSDLGDLSSLMTDISSTTPQLDSALTSMSSSLLSAGNAISATTQLIDSAIAKIDNFITKIENAQNGEKLKTLVTLLTQDPDTLSSFMSSPVIIDTETVYPIDNYGSGMAPFYTILCLWVGAVINCAILSVHPEKEDPSLTPNQAYFGRFLLFMVLAVAQALIVCLGDIWMLHIQCLHPVLFVLCGVFTSIVFSMIVYTLVVSFGDVGKAIAVLLLVIQVAGSGGTYPIETLPDFYQALYPIQPFNYGINAMRECIAGIYGNHYWMDIFKESLFIPVSLFVGLVLRKPIIRLDAYIRGKLEETNLIV